MSAGTWVSSLGCAAALASAASAAAAMKLPCVVTNTYGGVECVVNYDESRVAPYELEDPLKFADGRPVRTAADWEARREEILGIFAREMFGAEPPKPSVLNADLVDEKVACAGFAIRRQYDMTFRADRGGPKIRWIVWIPRWAKKPVPVISFLNYRGNHELVTDEDVPVMAAWSRNGVHVKDHRASAETRGLMQRTDSDSVFPLGMILARGYAVMSAC
ncbi:MAG: hypothetical protein IKE55_12650, partial [Kiritimatiellae bacterium]|nr:hypothetical protein [Kiritimatiellia bacterium]